MKKAILKTITLALVLAFMTPLTVNAAKLSIDKDEMKVGQPIEVTITTDKPVELMQFDLSFDKTKYEFVNATSKLSSTGSNLVKNKDTVRVSAFDLNGEKTDTVTLQFNAIATGESVPFTVGGTIELGEEGEDFGDNLTITVTKIGEADKSELGNVVVPDDDYYISEDGTVITRLPQTGDRKAIGNFSKLGALRNVIPYALSNPEDESIKRQEVEAEFPTMVNGTIGDFIKTGDTIDIEGITHNLVLYGDVNKDGRVTTSDALTIYKGRDSEGTIRLEDVQKEAADVQNDGEINKEDAFAVQEFILQSRTTETGTIINKNPVKTIENADITVTSDDASVKKFGYSKVKVATITASNGAKLTQELLQETKLIAAPDGAETNNVITIDINEDGTVATIYVYATVAGDYMVRPVISGSDVEDGEIRKNTIIVNVEENNAVTSIRLLDGTTDITNSNIVLGPSQEKQPTIEFYHTDYDQNGNPVGTPRKVNVNGTIAFMGIVPDGALTEYTALRNNNDEPIKYDSNKNPSGGIAQGTYVESIFIQSEELVEDTTATLTIEVDNSAYGIKDYQKEIKINIKQTERKTGIQLNGNTNPSNASLTLYTADPSQTNVKEVDGRVYTILPIALGDGTKISRDKISTKKASDIIGNISIFENASSIAWDIDIKGFTGNETDGYIAVRNDDIVPVDAIGIAFSNEEDDQADSLRQGITIKYDGIEGNKVVRKSIDVAVTVEEGVATTSEDDGIALMSEEGIEVQSLEETNNLDANKIVDKDAIKGQEQIEEKDVENKEEEAEDGEKEVTKDLEKQEDATSTKETLNKNEIPEVDTRK